MAFYRDTLSLQSQAFKIHIYIHTYINIFKQIESQQFAIPTEPQQILTAQILSHNCTRDELKNYLTGNL